MSNGRRGSLPHDHDGFPPAPLGSSPAQARLPLEDSRLLSRSLPGWPAVLLLIGLALILRVPTLNDFYTTDEAYFWQGRVERFADALETGAWEATNQTGHPGVTTMWLGLAGRQLALAQGAAQPQPGNGADYLAYLRIPLAVVNALAVGLGYLLLLQLLRPGTALIAGLLWASSPFLIAHSRLLHLDALLTSLMTLSLLSLLVAVRPRTSGVKRTLLLVMSGVLGGLALLTKAPALLLLPFAALALFGGELRGKPVTRPSLGAAVGPALRLALWLAVAATVFVLLWPAMWVAPREALGAVAEEILGNGARPHNAGNYYMGRPVADPGWSFYLAVMAWRGEVPTLIGLVTLVLLAGQRLVRRWRGSPLLVPALPEENRQALRALGLLSVSFTLALTLLAKKFDRYLLPIWPSLQILGAAGLVALAQLIVARSTLALPGRKVLERGLVAALLVAVLAPALIYRPYYLAYYNPLLGGGTTAQSVLLAGWGEGMEQVGGWLSGRPDLRRGPVLSWIPETLNPFVPGDVAVYDLDLDTMVRPANYVVVYSSVAARDTRAAAEAYALQTPPLYTVRVFGVTYATVHQVPRPYTTTAGAVFSGIHLRGFSHEFLDSTLVITPSWDIQVDREGGVFSFLHVLNTRGERVAQIDTLIDDGLFSQWQAGQQFGTPLPIVLPPDLPPGSYSVVLGLYTQPDGVRIPLSYGSPLPEEVAGAHVVDLLTFRSGPDRELNAVVK